MSKLRIAIFNWRDPEDPKSGGAEYATLKHAQHWALKGHTVTWISGSFSGAEKYFKKNNINFYRSGSSKTLFLRAWYLYWFVFKGNFDVVIDEVHGLPMFSPLWASRSKIVVFIHEVADNIWKEMFSFPVSYIGLFIERYVFPVIYKKQQFWVDAPSTKKDLRALGFSSKSITVIPCAIEASKIPKVKKQKKLICLFIARLVQMKGIEYTLEAFNLIIKKEPQAKLWVVGTGQEEYLNYLHKKIKNMGITKSIKFWGKVSEKQKFSLLGKAHVLLHTSIKEGFGLTVLEANSQKTPAVVFDVAGLRDIVKNKKNGFVVPFSNTKLLADRVVSLYRDTHLYSKISESSRQYSQTFSWNKFTKKSLDLIT